MLNGKYPILVFHLYAYNKIANSILGLVNQPPIDFAVSPVGIPIPFVLQQSLTGIAIENETKSIDIDTTIDAPLEATAPTIVKQTPIASNVNVALVAEKDSVFLTILSAIGDMLLRKSTAGDYGITYMSGPVAIFNGLLSRFTTMAGADDTLMRIDMTISTAKQEASQPDKPPNKTPVTKTHGTDIGPGSL